METKYDVILVSVFGRGHWLASELVSMGMTVALIDVSSSMGRWTPEDWEGPFGFFQTEHFPQSFLTRLHEEDYFDPVDEGFVIWLKEGPVDLRGLNSQHLLELYNLDQKRQNYVTRHSSFSTKELEKEKKEIMGSPFKESWFLHLTHQLAASVYEDNWSAVQSGQPLSVFSPYSLRRISRRGYENSVEWLKAKGVRVFQEAELKDLFTESKVIRGIEIKSDWSGVLLSEHLVWCLSSHETERFPKRFNDELFYGKPVTPTWAWVRYRIKIEHEILNGVLPKKFLIIDDKGLPWTHSNFIWVQSTVNASDYDTWIKVPYSQRFQRAYLEKQGESLLEIVRKKMPMCEISMLHYPQEHLYDELNLGPSRFPIFMKENLKKLRKRKSSRLHFDSPEEWINLDWYGQFQNQNRVLEKIKSWKAEEDAKKEKQMQALQEANP